MYTSKYTVNPKADLGHLSINVSRDKQKNVYVSMRDKNSRYEGKQISLPHKNELFSSFPFYKDGKGDPYQGRNSYLKAARKHGFGSSDPPKRDEFSNTIAIEQYREAIRSVNNSQAKAAKAILEKKALEGGGDEVLPSPEAKEEIEEFFEYDQAYSVKPDEIGKVRTWKPMYGSMRTTNTNYGMDCHQPNTKNTSRRTTSTALFFNNNHLTVGDHEH
ncbi:Hypothetical Protein FCC1311_004832 [Hondaea fermentalgiana]|uniref:Uncharacterized protein n=1 Tax=Hondaea fermentalgiana TaxID=2315210 RepID=A0A2R5G155_9STRA|nr:Hypothetical Protein FCC1311_004832 [Hondaea fermentalgiana]|eukprot:GBG24265.1 Hypothetical Protein FCC1311_004832 [Hondaea fermentalgiana]